MKIPGSDPQGPQVVVRPADVGLDDLLDPADAPLLAAQLLASLAHGMVRLDLSDVTGITTAFANHLIALLADAMAPDELRRRFGFRTANATQREVLRRSIRAVVPPSEHAPVG